MLFSAWLQSISGVIGHCFENIELFSKGSKESFISLLPLQFSCSNNIVLITGNHYDNIILF